MKKLITLVYKLIMQEKNNPLSPHLQIYKWQISSLSIYHHQNSWSDKYYSYYCNLFLEFIIITWMLKVIK